MDRGALEAELANLKEKVASLENQLAAPVSPHAWQPQGYYTTYHLLGGMVLGLFAASASLLFNIVGAMLVGRHPLELIRVYLTFPLGERALSLEFTDNGFIIAAGCCLYLATGMIGGIPFHMILSRWFGESSGGKRFVVATILGLGVWLVNFYGILSWLQPLLIGGDWIVKTIPIYVAIATHLVFGWTMLAIDQWGRFVPHPPVMQRSAP